MLKNLFAFCSNIFHFILIILFLFMNCKMVKGGFWVSVETSGLWESCSWGGWSEQICASSVVMGVLLRSVGSEEGAELNGAALDLQVHLDSS